MKSRAGALYLFQDVDGLSVPDEGLGVFVVMVDVMYWPMASMSSSTLRKMPRRSRFSVRSRKNRSTMFSHEQLVGVKCMWKRG